jgi:hypothetical protein
LPAGSSISHGSVITAGGGGAGGAARANSATSNPLALMTEQRRRQQQFLQAIPAAARPAGSNLAAALAQAGGRGVPVPAGSSLAKVMQQVVAAQKAQQEQLAETLAAANRPASAAAQHGENTCCFQGMSCVAVLLLVYHKDLGACSSCITTVYSCSPTGVVPGVVLESCCRTSFHACSAILQVAWVLNLSASLGRPTWSSASAK